MYEILQKKKQKGKSISISKIRKELNLDKDISDSIEQDKILKNNFEKTKIYLDKRSQNYLKTIYKQINYEDNEWIDKFSEKDITIPHYYSKEEKEKMEKINKQYIKYI